MDTHPSSQWEKKNKTNRQTNKYTNHQLRSFAQSGTKSSNFLISLNKKCRNLHKTSPFLDFQNTAYFKKYLQSIQVSLHLLSTSLIFTFLKVTVIYTSVIFLMDIKQQKLLHCRFLGCCSVHLMPNRTDRARGQEAGAQVPDALLE